MWAFEAQEAARQQRLEHLEVRRVRQPATDFAQRVAAAASQCTQRGSKRFTVPPREAFCKDVRGRELLEEIDLEELEIATEWLAAIAAHAVSLGAVQVARCKRIALAGTSVSDTGIAHLSKFKQLAALDISRCSSLTNESLTMIRRHFGLLQELHISECRHFTTPLLCQLWKDCSHLHTLSARGCPAVTDAFLQCVATTKRSSAEFTLRSLDVRHCKHVTSSGISYLATSLLKDLAVVSLSVGDCLDVDNMAFFGFETSAGLRDLRALNLSGLSIDETAVSWIATGCRALEHLNLSRCKAVTDFALLLLAALVRPDSPLVHLNLKECQRITDVGIKNLFSLAEQDKKLKSAASEDDDGDGGGEVRLLMLSLKNCPLVGDEAMETIAKHCVSLVKLNLKGLRRLSDRGVAHVAKACPTLVSLKLSGRHITALSFQLLGRLLRRLDAIDVSERQDLDTPLCIMHLTAPRATYAHSLKHINLSATNVCDVGVSMIAVNCRQLERINLSKCAKLTDVAVEALASCCFQLRELLLANAKGVTDRSLLACARTKLPLRVVDVCSNTNITDAGVRALCSACQELQELRLRGCDRVSLQTVEHCGDRLLPFTRAMQSPTLSQKIATGGASAAMALASLPARHVALLRRMALHYDSAAVLQAKFRRWKRKEASLLFLSRRRLLRESRAARKIQSCARRFLAWRRYIRLLSLERNAGKIAFVQAHARGNACRWRVRVLRFAVHRGARVIQRAVRPMLRAQLRRRHASALSIQRVYRGSVGRAAFKCRVFERALEAGAAIWRWYRRCKHQRDFRRRSLWLVLKIRRIQGQWRKHQRRANLTKYLGFYRAMATRIQSLWRRALARLLVRRMRVEMIAGALAIQRVYRGCRARARVKAFRALANAQATRIQSHWRRVLARRAYVHARLCVVRAQRMARYAGQVRRFREVVRNAVAKHRNAAATAIQRHVRGWRGRKRALLHRKIRNARCAHRGQNARQAMARRALMRRGAATVIQRWIRRVQARRRMLKVRRWRRYVAARCVQRYLRAWLRVLRQRQRREAKTHAAVTVERVFRGHRGRCLFAAERHRQRCLQSARRIQRVYRGHRGRRFAAHVRAEKTRAALLLQRAFRSRHARQLYEISQAVAALKAKDKYEHSLRGWLDAKRNPMDELYRRARLPREKAALEALLAKWDANRVAEERAARKFRREHRAAWDAASEPLGNYFAVRRKLYGVTENVYASNAEFAARQTRHAALHAQLLDLHARVAAFKAAIADAAASRRLLDGSEVFALLTAHGLFREGGSNQDDAD